MVEFTVARLALTALLCVNQTMQSLDPQQLTRLDVVFYLLDLRNMAQSIHASPFSVSRTLYSIHK